MIDEPFDWSPAANARRTRQSEILVRKYGVERIIELAQQEVDDPGHLEPEEKQAIAAFVWLSQMRNTN